jgi:hypothetical protein
MAKIYAVGVGPGDPELLTRKAERILREVAVVCAPTASPADSSYALSIVESFLDRKRQEVIVQVFPMRKDQEGLAEFWEAAADEVAEKVRQGRDVAFHLPLPLPDLPGEVPRHPRRGGAGDLQRGCGLRRRRRPPGDGIGADRHHPRGLR